MMDSFRSSLLFFRANKGAVILLIATLSLIFFACLVLHSLTLNGNFGRDSYGDDIPRTYEIYYQPANRDVTLNLINTLYQSAPPIEEVSIIGSVEVLNPNYRPRSAEDEEPITKDMTGSQIQSNGSGESGAYFTLIGFEKNPNTPIDILRGSDRPGAKEVLIDAWMYSLIDDFIVSDPESKDSIHLASGEIRHVAGVVSLRDSHDNVGILVEKESYFSMTDTSSELRVLFVKSLTKEEENRLIKDASGIVSISNMLLPSDSMQSAYTNDTINLLLSRVVVVICLLCAMRLMVYLFLLRRQELSVLRLLGAGSSLIATYVFVMIFVVSCASIGIGYSAYLLLAFFRITEKFLYPLSPDMIWSDVIFFALATLMTGFSMFFLNNKVDVTRANEEV